MKFSFKFAIVCASFSVVFGQFWPGFYQSSYPSNFQNSYPNRYPNSYLNTYQNQLPNRNDDHLINQETVPSTSLSLNSCENYWTIQNDGNGVWGHLSINSPNKEQAIIKVILTVAAALPTKYVGDIDLLKSKEATSSDVANGHPIEYRINFPLQHTIPKLSEIYYNNQLLCRGQKAVGQTVTTITLDHSFFTGLSNNGYFGEPNIYNTLRPTPRPTNRPFTNRPITHPPVTYPPVTQPPVTYYQTETYRPETQRPRTQKPTTRPPPIVTRPPIEIGTSLEEKLLLLNSQCGGRKGVNLRNTTSLVVKGKVAVPGQFPWLAAYYHNDESFNGFICGGSLVSHKIVITAAHCMNDKTDPSFVRKPEQAIIYIGRYNLQSEIEVGYLSSGASKFIMHPDWNPSVDTYDGDIAAIVLYRTIDKFTALLQPICIWDSTDNHHDIINHTGTVAGFGKTQTSVLGSNVPYWSTLPVVDDRTCFDSNNVFLKMTSRRTFCGGNLDGRGPCNGDSGGAFIIDSNNRSYLRGIISASLLIQETNMCDTYNYAVFTDVAAFKDWIYNLIDIYE